MADNVVHLPGLELVRPPAEDSMLAAVNATIEALEHLTDADAAIVRLVRQLAAAIDASPDAYESAKDLGPKLRLALESLTATPKARGSVRPHRERQGALARLRAARS